MIIEAESLTEMIINLKLEKQTCKHTAFQDRKNTWKCTDRWEENVSQEELFGDSFDLRWEWRKILLKVFLFRDN